MSIKLQLPRVMDMRPRLSVIGIGGAGCNAINNMIASGLTGVDFVVANTDAQALASSSAERRVQLGATLTEGLGAGSRPEIGEAAAEEAMEELRSHVVGSHMLFIAAGMGGGTGTGAAAVVARIAKELGILTVAIVTKPFQFEGARRKRIAEIGIEELRQHVDTLIVIPNQNLFRVATPHTTFAEAFVMADQVLYSGVACIVDLIIKEGLINLDFADVRTVLAGMGTAMMGTGEAEGERRAIEAAEEAIANPLLDDVSLKGARGLLLSISGGRDLTLYEVDEAASRVRAEVDPEANIIVGATFDESLGDRVRVSIVASGMMRQTQSDSPGGGFGHDPGGLGAGSPVGRTDSSNERGTIATPATTVPPMFAPFPASPESQPSFLPNSPTSTDPGQRPQAAAPTAPPEPAHAPAPQRPAPVGNDADAAELQRRLSEALTMTTFDEFAAEHSRDHGPDPSVSWRRGGVTIEDLPPLPLSSEPPSRIPATAKQVRAEEAPFRPELQANVRRPPPRIPDIKDFPPLAQQEYAGRADPPRKPSLLGRFGLGRRTDESNHERAADARTSHDSRHEPSAPPNRNAQLAGDRGGQGEAAVSRQDVDMPAVLRKDRR